MSFQLELTKWENVENSTSHYYYYNTKLLWITFEIFQKNQLMNMIRTLT
jgi:hypothetical protein